MSARLSVLYDSRSTENRFCPLVLTECDVRKAFVISALQGLSRQNDELRRKQKPLRLIENKQSNNLQLTFPKKILIVFTVTETL